MSDRLDRIEKILEEASAIAKEASIIAKEANDTVKAVAKQQEKTDAQIARTDAQIARTDAQIAKVSKQLGGFVNNAGLILEDRIYRCFEESLGQDNPIEIEGVRYDRLNRNISGKFGQTTGQYDIILFNHDHVLIVEVKKKAHVNDLEQILKQKQTFPIVFPHFRSFNFHLGLASESFSKDLISEAKANEIYLMQEKAGVIQIVAP